MNRRQSGVKKASGSERSGIVAGDSKQSQVIILSVTSLFKDREQHGNKNLILQNC